MSHVEKYKVASAYTEMHHIDSDDNSKIKSIYERNIWKLKSKFLEYRNYLQAVNKRDEIAWLNNIQYLTYKTDTLPIPENTIYLDELSKGTYTSLNVDERNAGKYNKPETDAKYARRIKFWMDNNFVEQRESSKPEHPLYWIVEHHQQLMYKIMTYHNQQNNSLSSLNSDFKALVRIVKLILGNKSELRYKLSALQIGLSELENANDDENKISSLQEERQYIRYEELLDKCKKLEDEYVEKATGSATDIERFTIHQLLLCVALYVWDYPSRQEKYTLEFMEEGEIAEDGKNYVVIPKGKNKKRCSFIFNEVKKNHQPIEYEIKTANKELDILNKKLSDLLKYSYRKYPRRYVFVGKKVDKSDTIPKLKAKTISEWVRDMYVNKNLGIDGFRSSFVSYYLPRMNNLEKKVMATRMRTSIDIMYRSYLKLPSISEKEEKAVENPENKKVEKTITIIPNRREQSKENFKNWYEKSEENKQKHRERVKQNSNTEETYAKRIVRELNAGKIAFEKIKEQTKAKYGLKKREDGEYYSDKY